MQGVRTYSGTLSGGLPDRRLDDGHYGDHYLNENARARRVESLGQRPTLSFSVQQNLLQGLGITVNSRNITVAKMNLQMSDLNFKTQVSGTVVNVLNTYYSLVADYDDLKAKQDALDTAQKFFDESRKRLELGALSQLDVTTAENQIAVSRLALVNSQVALSQQQLQLKNLISRDWPGRCLCLRTSRLCRWIIWSFPPPTIFRPSKTWCRRRSAIAAISLWSEAI